MLRCLAAAFEPYRSEYTPEAFADTVLTPARASARLASMRILIAEEESGVVAGTIAWGRRTRSTGLIRGMAVLPQWQGTGVARALLDRALTELVDAGCNLATLGTTAVLRRAIGFYEKAGFRPSGHVEDFFGMRLIEWSKRLPGPPAPRHG